MKLTKLEGLNVLLSTANLEKGDMEFEVSKIKADWENIKKEIGPKTYWDEIKDRERDIEMLEGAIVVGEELLKELEKEKISGNFMCGNCRSKEQIHSEAFEGFFKCWACGYLLFRAYEDGRFCQSQGGVLIEGMLKWFGG